MTKEVLACAGGIVVGVAICYAGYRLYKCHLVQNEESTKNFSAEKVKVKDVKSQRLADLIADQTYVELLTTRELTRWFKENRSRVASDAKMLIVTATKEHMQGLGYPAETDLDEDTNLVQLFYDEENGDALLIRLVNYVDIDSNLHAKLIEREGMIVVTD